MEYTKGPWEQHNRAEIRGGAVYRPVCMARSLPGELGPTLIFPHRGDHQLVLVAPDLYEACKAVVEYDERFGGEMASKTHQPSAWI
jgi:hypothetical protein